jgi:hypothetical protein
MEILWAGIVPVGVQKSKVCARIMHIAQSNFHADLTSPVNHGTIVKEASLEGMPVWDYEESMRKLLPEYQATQSKYNRIGNQFTQVAVEIEQRLGLKQHNPPLVASSTIADK